MKNHKLYVIAVVMMCFLFGASSIVQAATVIYEGNTAIGIDGLELDGVVYDVTFVYQTGLSLYGEDGNFPFDSGNTEEQTFAASQAVNAVLNSAPVKITQVGPSSGPHSDYFYIGAGQESVDPGNPEAPLVIAAYESRYDVESENRPPNVWTMADNFLIDLCLFDECDAEIQPYPLGMSPPLERDVQYSWAAFALDGGAPPPADVSVGGTVTGLTSSGLVLQNNGADDEAITSDGGFSFDTPVTPGTTYNVTVETQPGDPSQECTVSNGYGTVPTDGVDDVLVTCTDPVENIPPVADPNGPYNGLVNESITFDGAGSYDVNGDTITYDWDFGDGNSGTGVDPTHAYTAADTYTVSLTVNDGTVDSTPVTTTVSVTEAGGNTPPVADPNGPYSATVNESITFDGTGSSDVDNDSLTYDWDFGDGNSGTGVNPTHAYAATGTYTVSLTVNDGTVDSTPVTTTSNIGVAGEATLSPLYRFWSDQNQTHFYSINEEEKDATIENYPDDVWKYETVSYDAFAPGEQPVDAKPVYRFWSDQNQAHFFTISEEEKDATIENYPDDVWRYETIAYYAYAPGTQPDDAKPVYRFWSDLNQVHFYTISEEEKDATEENYPDDVWRLEGIVYYAYETTQQTPYVDEDTVCVGGLCAEDPLVEEQCSDFLTICLTDLEPVENCIAGAAAICESVDIDVVCGQDLCATDPALQEECSDFLTLCLAEGEPEEDCVAAATLMCQNPSDVDVDAVCGQELCATDSTLADQCEVFLTLCLAEGEPEEDCVAGAVLMCQEPSDVDVDSVCSQELCATNSDLETQCKDFMTVCLAEARTDADVEGCLDSALLICTDLF